MRTAQPIAIRFFLGISSERTALTADEVQLDCRDDYQHMPQKFQGICRWAKKEQYDFAVIGDDDAYMRPERFLSSNFESCDYTGRVRPSLNRHWAFPFCSGIGFCLSAKAISILASASFNGDHCDDRWAGQVLAAAGIQPHHDYRYGVSESRRNMVSLSEGPRAGNELFCVGEFKDLDAMKRIHHAFLATPSDPTKLNIVVSRFNSKYGLQPHHQPD